MIIKTFYDNIPYDDVYFLYNKIYYSNSPLRENYSKKKLDLKSALAISITYRNDVPICISSILERDIFNNTSRCLNRYFYDCDSNPNKNLHLSDYESGMRKSTITMLDQQVDLSKKLGFDGCFVSTEHHKIYRKKAIKGFNFHSKYNWTLTPNYYLIMKKCEHIISCWQTIIYHGTLGLLISKKFL